VCALATFLEQWTVDSGEVDRKSPDPQLSTRHSSLSTPPEPEGWVRAFPPLFRRRPGGEAAHEYVAG
jgi:hypothetical protein